MTDAVIEFGKFRLDPGRRRLEADGEPVRIGGRALEILIVLAERSQEVVSQAELIKRVWPAARADPSSLRFHIKSLRRALGDSGDGERVILNVQGRGYCFVAPLKRPGPAIALAQKVPAAERAGRLPALPPRMVRQDQTATEISARLRVCRFITLVGPGGIGKTTGALAAAHALTARDEADVRFADLGALTQSEQVPRLLASIFGLLVQVEDPTPTVLAFLREKHIVLILDSCEHVIESAARLAEQIYQTAPMVSIVATSREPLRVEGEHVVRVPPLEAPAESMAVTAREAVAFPAVQLFLDRARAGGRPADLTDEDAALMADICRKVDGVALAIEVVAGQVDAYGLPGVSALLNDNLSLLWAGRRTALARHQSLNAMLAWSYNLLTDDEQRLLRRLSVFVGGFTLEMALSVAGEDEVDGYDTPETLAALVAKSLVSTEDRSAGRSYRLLDTTRAYAQAKLQENGEFDAMAGRHARRFLALLEEIARKAPALRQAAAYGAYVDQIGNVRAALRWSFSAAGDAELGVKLAAAASPLFVSASLVTECRDWTEQGLSRLTEGTVATRYELELQFSILQALLLTVGNPAQVGQSLRRALELAERFDDPYEQLRFLGAQHLYQSRICEFWPALETARKMETIALKLDDPAARSISAALLSISHHRAGELEEARRQSDLATSLLPLTQRIDLTKFGYDHRSRAVMASARTLWLIGLPDQAVAVARRTLDVVEQLNHSGTTTFTLTWMIPVFLWIGDWTSAESLIEQLLRLTAEFPVVNYNEVGLCLKGEYLLKRGRLAEGLGLIETGLERLSGDRTQATGQICALAEGLRLTGQFDRARGVINDALADVEANGHLVFKSDMLRVRGDILAAGGGAADDLAEEAYLDAITTARRQGAVSLELRAALGLAALLCRRGRRPDARVRIGALYDRFDEGFETMDLRAARAFLSRQSASCTPADS